MEKIYHANTNPKIGGVVILLLDRTDVKVRKVIRDKEGHYIVIKGSVLQKYIFLICMCLTREHHNP